MSLTIGRRNEITWLYLLHKVEEVGLNLTDFDSPDTRQQIRVTAELLGISFEEAMDFAKQVLKETNR